MVPVVVKEIHACMQKDYTDIGQNTIEWIDLSRSPITNCEPSGYSYDGGKQESYPDCTEPTGDQVRSLYWKWHLYAF